MLEWGTTAYHTIILRASQVELVVKEPLCQCRRHKRPGFHPWVRKIPWRRAHTAGKDSPPLINGARETIGWHWTLPIPQTQLTKTHSGPHQAFPLLASLKMDLLCNNLHTGNCSLFPYLSLLRRGLPLGPEDTELLPAWMLPTFVQKLKLQSVLRKLTCQC